MKKLRNSKKFGIVFLSAVILSACGDSSASPSDVSSSAATSEQSNETSEQAVGTDLTGKVAYDNDDYDTDWSKESSTVIELNGTDANISGSGAAVKDGSITITAAGTYVLSGKWNDGQIVVDVQDKGVVQLVLNGAVIHNSVSAPIYVKEAGKTVITLQEGTENIVSDGETYAYSDASTDEPNASIFSKDDLTFNGKGKLTVHGNYNNGITSKDELKLTGGTIDIHAVDDGLMARDMVAVQQAAITIEAGGDGIKTTNDTDASKGFIAIEGGTFNIKAGSDGIQGASSVLFGGGSYTIVSGGGSKNGRVKTDNNRPGPWGNRTAQSANQLEETESQSAKAVKATADIVVNSGTFNIDSADDAIHGNSHITITGGDFDINSGDDGIHADASITIIGGTMAIAKSYEGIESAAVTISDGDIHVTASDDGINIAGGNDGSSTNGRPGQNQFSTSENNKLTIHGGAVTVDAAGDGLDANGSIYVTGGTVIVNGPTGNNNGSLDYDGTFEMSGGFLVAAGSSGMPQTPSEESKQYSVIMNYSQTQQAGSMVHLEDSKGNTVVTFAPSKNYQAIVISSPNLKKDSAYTLYSGGTSNGSKSNGLYNDGEYQGGTKVVEFEITTPVTWLSESGVTAARSGHPGGPNKSGRMGPNRNPSGIGLE